LASNITQIPIPQPQANTQATRQITVDPLQQPQGTITPIPIPGNTTNTQQPAQPAQTANSIFSGVDPSIRQGYTQTLADSLSGKIYDPFAAGSKEAMARAEANQRASTAGQIASAGFSGTGIGQQIAGGTENQLLQNRFTTLNGIEQARNEGRQNALGEARAYGTAEEGVRQYNQNFTEDQRRYNQDFAEDQSRYKDTQEWKAYEEALVNGSDADVAAAYKAATGKDLDPMAISQYRGYARKAIEQGLESGDIANQQGRQNLTTGNIAIQAAQQTLDTMKRTDAGTALSSYLTTHLDANASDPAVSGMLQKYWESLGNSGPMPKDWADQQLKAARDVRVNTEQGALNYQIDQQIAQGVMTPEQGELLKGFNLSQLTNFLVKDPTTGKVTFDTAAYLKSVSGSGADTNSIIDPATGKTRTEGSVYVGEDGNIYKVENGSETKTSLDDIAYPTISYEKQNGADVGSLNTNIGDFVKLNTEDGLQPLKLTSKLRTSDNQQYYVFTDTKGKEMRLFITGPSQGYWQTQKTTGAKYNTDGTIDHSQEKKIWVNGKKIEIK
jgi:hypothetical protein